MVPGLPDPAVQVLTEGQFLGARDFHARRVRVTHAGGETPPAPAAADGCLHELGRRREQSGGGISGHVVEVDFFDEADGELVVDEQDVVGGVDARMGILLWLGARERRQFSTMRDADLGDLKLFKTYWETATPRLLGQQDLSISGVGRSTGPTLSQKATLEFVKANAGELSGLAIGAARAAAADLQLHDLRVSAVFLHKEPNSFELALESESCAAAMPDGVDVSFTGKQVDEVEFVH